MGLFGGIEAGGTKFVCAIGSGPDDLRAQTSFPTTTPGETIHRALEFFATATEGEALAALGIASFGPVDLDPGSATFGYLTSTPKPGWAQVDLVGPVARATGVPVGFDTDVNGAALAEFRWGVARGLETFVYLTVGTGIGGGAMVGGRRLHGLLHPEMGHMLVPRRDGDEFAGCCPYHGACLEGMASGPAIGQRWSRRAEDLPEDHPAWDLEAWYLGAGLVNLICALSPQRLILGGGVMDQEQLFPLVRGEVRRQLHGYIDAPSITGGDESFIVAPGLGNRSGVLGAIGLAEEAAGRGERRSTDS